MLGIIVSMLSIIAFTTTVTPPGPVADHVGFKTCSADPSSGRVVGHKAVPLRRDSGWGRVMIVLDG